MLRSVRSMTMQSKRHSFLESFTQIVVGYLIGLLTQIIVLPHYGISVGIGTNVKISFIFTVVSFLRLFLIRRMFNSMTTPGE